MDLVEQAICVSPQQPGPHSLLGLKGTVKIVLIATVTTSEPLNSQEDPSRVFQVVGPHLTFLGTDAARDLEPELLAIYQG